MNELPYPYHPGLPSVEAAQANPKTIYADHLPILVEIIVAKNSENKDLVLNMLSWNVWASGGPSGFDLTETTTQKKARYEKIADALVRLIKVRIVPVIALQEVDKDFQNILENKLGIDSWFTNLNWSLEYGRGQSTGDWGVMTLYDNSYFERVKHPKNIVTADIDGYQQIVLKQKIENKKEIVINNVHKVHTNIPFHTEQQIATLLNDNTPNRVVVAIGDWNTRFAPPINPQTGLRPENIMTGAVPSCFSFCENTQGLDFTDAAFYRDLNGKPAQAMMKTLDPNTWKPYTTKIDISMLSEVQGQELLRYRVLGCIDQQLQENIPDFEGQNIFQYEIALRKSLGCSETDLYVRHAANGLNVRTICIVICPELSLLFKAVLQKEKIEKIYCKNATIGLGDHANYMLFYPDYNLSLGEFYTIINNIIQHLNKIEISGTPICQFQKIHNTKLKNDTDLNNVYIGIVELNLQNAKYVFNQYNSESRSLFNHLKKQENNLNLVCDEKTYTVIISHDKLNSFIDWIKKENQNLKSITQENTCKNIAELFLEYKSMSDYTNEESKKIEKQLLKLLGAETIQSQKEKFAVHKENYAKALKLNNFHTSPMPEYEFIMQEINSNQDIQQKIDLLTNSMANTKSDNIQGNSIKPI